MAFAAALLLAPLAALHAAEQRGDDTPPGKIYVYKHSAGKPQEM